MIAHGAEIDWDQPGYSPYDSAKSGRRWPYEIQWSFMKSKGRQEMSVDDTSAGADPGDAASDPGTRTPDIEPTAWVIEAG